MYPAAMPMPNGPCVAVALPEDNAARLSWLHETCLSSLNWESDAEEVSYLLLVHYDFPPELRDHWTMKGGKGLYGPHSLSPSRERRAWTASGSSSCGTCWARSGGCTGPTASPAAPSWRLHGAQAQLWPWRPHGVRLDNGMRLKNRSCCGRRQFKTAGSVVAEKVVKLTQNAIFGRCCMNPDKFRNTNAYVDPAKFERAVGKTSSSDQRLGGVPGLCGDAQDGAPA